MKVTCGHINHSGFQDPQTGQEMYVNERNNRKTDSASIDFFLIQSES